MRAHRRQVKLTRALLTKARVEPTRSSDLNRSLIIPCIPVVLTQGIIRRSSRVFLSSYFRSLPLTTVVHASRDGRAARTAGISEATA